MATATDGHLLVLYGSTGHNIFVYIGKLHVESHKTVLGLALIP